MNKRLDAIYAQTRASLLARRNALAAEIARHPRPITACDVHFNRLLEERAALSEELDRFDAFVASSAVLTREAKDNVLAAEDLCP